MELLTIQHLQDAKPTHIITACEDTDTCPSCGAGYKVGLSACEYCRRPVQFDSQLFDEKLAASVQRLIDREVSLLMNGECSGAPPKGFMSR